MCFCEERAQVSQTVGLVQQMVSLCTITIDKLYEQLTLSNTLGVNSRKRKSCFSCEGLQKMSSPCMYKVHSHLFLLRSKPRISHLTCYFISITAMPLHANMKDYCSKSCDPNFTVQFCSANILPMSTKT